MLTNHGEAGSLVPAKKKLVGEAVTVRCAHGDTALYPPAEVEMELEEDMKLNVKAAMSESLPVSVLLWTDVAELNGLLRSACPWDCLHQGQW